MSIKNTFNCILNSIEVGNNNNNNNNNSNKLNKNIVGVNICVRPPYFYYSKANKIIILFFICTYYILYKKKKQKLYTYNVPSSITFFLNYILK